MKNFKVMMMTLMMCLMVFSSISCNKENDVENKVPCENYEVYDFSDNALPNTDNTVLYLTTNLNLFSVWDSLILKPTEKSPPLPLFTNNRLIIENIEETKSPSINIQNIEYKSLSAGIRTYLVTTDSEHGFSNGDIFQFNGLESNTEVGGNNWENLNKLNFSVSNVISPNSFTIDIVQFPNFQDPYLENSGSLNTVKEVALTINLNFEELISNTLYKNYVEQHGRLQFTLDLYCN